MTRDQNHYSLSPEDFQILNGYKKVIDMIGNVFGNTCECVLHSLDSLENSVIHIHNGEKTNRKVGSPITDKALAILEHSELEGEDVTPVYRTLNKDGNAMRSTTMVIRNPKGMPIGMICLNFDISTPLVELVKILCNELNDQNDQEEYEHFAQNIDDLFTTSVNKVKNQVYADSSIAARLKLKTIITILNEQGLFKVRNSAVRVANLLNVSRDAVYLHLRACKNS